MSRSTFLLQLWFLDRDHVIRLLRQHTLCAISILPSSSPASSYSIYYSFHLFLFIFLPFGVADRHTQGGADGHEASSIQWQGPRVTLANMRVGHAQPKSILNSEYDTERQIQKDRHRKTDRRQRREANRKQTVVSKDRRLSSKHPTVWMG